MANTIINLLAYSKSNAELIGVIGHNATLAGKVLIKGLPARRKVCLYNRLSGTLAGVTLSEMNGNYAFSDLNPAAEYYALAIDHDRNYNAVIQDMLRTD